MSCTFTEVNSTMIKKILYFLGNLKYLVEKNHNVVSQMFQTNFMHINTYVHTHMHTHIHCICFIGELLLVGNR